MIQLAFWTGNINSAFGTYLQVNLSFCQDSLLTALLGSSIKSALNLTLIISIHFINLWHLCGSYHIKAMLSGFENLSYFHSVLYIYTLQLYIPLGCPLLFTPWPPQELYLCTDSGRPSNISFWDYAHRHHGTILYITYNLYNASWISLFSEFLLYLLLSCFDFLKLVAVFCASLGFFSYLLHAK